MRRYRSTRRRIHVARRRRISYTSSSMRMRMRAAARARSAGFAQLRQLLAARRTKRAVRARAAARKAARRNPYAAHRNAGKPVLASTPKRVTKRAAQ